MSTLSTKGDPAALSARVSGEVLDASSPSYDEARAMWNGAIDRRPAVIVRCKDVEDISAAIGFARDADLPLGVRGGGHGYSGLAIVDDGLLLDLSLMRSIEVDTAARRATVQPGVLGGEMDRATQEHGLATTLGTISHTGIAGLTLGGGMGWLMRKHGLACDNLVAADIVLADGRLVRADSESDPDLLWALRGAGAQLGVVSSLEYELHPLSPTVCASQFVFLLDNGRDALRTARDIAAAAGRGCDFMLACIVLPDAPHVPAEVRGRHAFVVIAFSDDPTDSDGAWLQPLRAMSPMMELTKPCAYVELQAMWDRQNPHGIVAYGTGAFLDELTDDALDIFVDQAQQLTGTSIMYVQQMGGAVADRDEHDAVAQGRSADYAFNVVTRWHEPHEADAWRAEADRINRTFDAHALDTVPLNFVGRPAGLDEQIYGGSRDRLAQIKERVDPHGVFGRPWPLEGQGNVGWASR